MSNHEHLQRSLRYQHPLTTAGGVNPRNNLRGKDALDRYQILHTAEAYLRHQPFLVSVRKLPRESSNHMYVDTEGDFDDYDKMPEKDYGADENGWKDGLVAHSCGFHIEQHSLVAHNGRNQWVCPFPNMKGRA